jgi:hypothetical protein
MICFCVLLVATGSILNFADRDNRRLTVLMETDLQVYSMLQVLEDILYVFWRESIVGECCTKSEYSVSVHRQCR